MRRRNSTRVDERVCESARERTVCASSLIDRLRASELAESSIRLERLKERESCDFVEWLPVESDTNVSAAKVSAEPSGATRSMRSE